MAVPTAKSGYIMNNGNPLSYLEWGRPEDPAVILIQPIRHSAFELRAIAEQIQGSHRIVVVNLRGHGDSGPFPVRAYDPDGYVDDLHAFVTALELQPVTILGYSVVMSGATVGFAAAYPELTRAIILVDGGPGYRQENAESAGRRVRAMPLDFPSWEDAVTYFGNLEDQKHSSKELHRERAPYIFRQLPDGNVTWKHDRILREQWPGEDWAKNTGRLPEEVWQRVRCPILVAKGGGNTHLTVDDCEKMTQYGTDSSWVAIPAVTTHHVHNENPAGFAGIIKAFLDKNHQA